MKEFKPGDPIYAGQLNAIVKGTHHWQANVEAGGHWLLGVGGITCFGDINVMGTFKINGVPLTAFRPVPEKVILRESVISKEPTIVREVVQEGVLYEPGDNISFDNGKIHSDPGDWDEFLPHADARGQYIVYGPICFIQMHVSAGKYPSVRLTLPFPSAGPVQQSLSGYRIVDRFIDVDPQQNHFISGAYRIA